MAETQPQHTDGTETQPPKVSYVIATYNRKEDVAEAVQSVVEQSYPNKEIVVVSNATDGTAELFGEDCQFDGDEVRFMNLEGRMGPPKARNIGYREASGDILVTIDDDAVFRDPDATERIVDAFDAHPDTGVLAFQSRDYYTDDIIRLEIPDPPIGTPADIDEPYETTFFIGVGNAIRRVALEAAGYYPEAFVYGFEEMDLSLRILDAGYDIRYIPSVAVEHKKSAAGRTPDQAALANQLENRLRILARNLPWHHVALSAVGWSAYTLARGGFTPVSDAFNNVFETREELLAERSVLKESTLECLRSRGGMFGWWYGPDPRRFLEDGVGLDRLWW